VEQQNWNFWISGMSGGSRMKHILKGTLCLKLRMLGLVECWGIEVSGNPLRNCHPISQEAKAWAALDLPTGQ